GTGRTLAALAALLASGPLTAETPAAPIQVDRVVLMMRHGIRPPTKAQPMPIGTASAAWPSWSVKPGWLTEHGANAIV
ncbi:histidine-type phosphatase, partial [Pseudomonas sp. FW305-47B]